MSLNKKTWRLIHRDPAAFKTITADNGTEFHQYRAIEADRKIRFYFANSYHSWERGPDEDLRLQFEAVSRMPPEEKKIVKALLEGMIVKYQTRQMVSGLSG